MQQAGLRQLVPDASAEACDILEGARGPLQPPIRAELFGLERFVQHGRSLGETHRAGPARSRWATFFPRLRDNIDALRQAHQYIGAHARTGYDISPAAEWLLDNFHLIEAQLREVHEGLPRSYFRGLPILLDEPLNGLPRIYGVAWAFVAHTDGAFDDELLVRFLSAYQETRELNLGETWALPTTLRVVLIENLRRLAERVAVNKAARELANVCCELLDNYSTDRLDQVLALLDLRGVRQVFLAQLARRLLDRRTIGDARHFDLYQEWLQAALPDMGAVRAQQTIDQAADNLSVSNAVTSLRAIGDADWPGIVARSSPLMHLMLSSEVFLAEDSNTRDQTLHAIERLARRARCSEVALARALMGLLHGADSRHESAVPGYWLRGAGRAQLWQALGLKTSGLSFRWSTLARRAALPAYLGGLLIGTLWLVASLLQQRDTNLAFAWLTVIGAGMMALPASEAVLAVVNRLISESMPPRHLPRLALQNGIPPEHRVLVVIPAMLTSLEAVQVLVHRLHLHYLANPEPQAQFALLSDWADADSAQVAADLSLLAHARQLIQELNARHPPEAPDSGAAARFLLLHRERIFCKTEQRWMGWERKRGKLEQLIAALAQGSSNVFMDLGALSHPAQQTRYLVTLDCDTQLPPGRLRELVGVAAHPQNQPQLDANARAVISGYVILQPRVATPLPAPHESTLYHWLFAGQCGIDPYSAASSEVYQDLFDEGTFTGKGLFNVAASHALLAGRLPPGLVLSHDLLEGSLTRCAVVSDITLIEDAPFHSDVAASRIHRWTRGDWQLLPFLLSPQRYRLLTINRWKMIDNLRRSLVAPMSLGVVLLSLGGALLPPWLALALVLAAFAVGPLMGAVAAFVPSGQHVALRHFYQQASGNLLRTLWTGIWHLAQLLQRTLLALDAILRALYRMLLSRRHLLQWTTAAAAQAQAETRFAAILRQHWKEPGVALALLAAFAASATPHWQLACLLCLLWAGAPLWTWLSSRPRLAQYAEPVSAQQRIYLEGVARDTWRFFERCVVAADNHLPPDNLQITPYEMVAHRTSPTNIGLYLLSVACARQFGWIGTEELLVRLQATLETLSGLERHRGHFLNWYDTQSGQPLLPRYVSSVDSGNLCGHLIAVAQACRALARAPHDMTALRRALQAGQQRLAPLLKDWAELAPELQDCCAMSCLHAKHDLMSECLKDPAQIQRLLAQARDEVADFLQGMGQSAPHNPPSRREQLACLLSDQLATLHSVWLDTQAIADANASSTSASAEAARRLLALAATCEQIAWQADFAFLYHPKRHLLHIGYRVAEQQLDAGYYDLLASESRLTSLLAIAKGDVPVRHWISLGRPSFARGANAGLHSWAGSMFEYLMPGLVLDEPHGSLLREACEVALQAQIDFAQAHDVPWGISESAYAASDYTLAYQYAPQGVPTLALRRTPADELVIAPYATALASQLSARRAVINFKALERCSARTRYGFIEALDFSPTRQLHGERFTAVSTFMSHHQGMSIVALANTLLDNTVQSWAMSHAHLEAVASLLHECPPREILTPYVAPTGELLHSPRQRRASGLLRHLVPGELALEPTHILSNGRYSVALRPNGAGFSRYGQTGITRWRDDALRDAYGSFFYLHRLNQLRAAPTVSITRHPAPDPNANYRATYHADRVSFEASWPDLHAQSTVWVSPEDDIEFRQVELRNLGHSSIELDLMSVFEVSLAEDRTDAAHPAFSNMFVRAEWQSEHQALVFERMPRIDAEQGLLCAHFLTATDAHVLGLRCQTDRQRWLGRNRAANQPLAALSAVPNAVPGSAGGLSTGLDPISVLVARLRLGAQDKAVLTFATAASHSATTLHAVIDKYRQTSYVQRASLMSATLTSIRMLSLRINPESLAAIQTLSTALLMSLSRPAAGQALADPATPPRCDRRLLWRFGISGDRPLLLVSANNLQSIGLLRSLIQALGLWTLSDVACDMVLLNAEPSSYLAPLQRELSLLRERHMADVAAQSGRLVTALHVLRTCDLSREELCSLQALARIWFQADERPLLEHVEQWLDLHQAALARRQAVPSHALTAAPPGGDVTAAPVGEFAADGGEFAFNVSADSRPLRPWINVLANPGFGCQITEAGGGYTWAVNSRLNQLTGWSNDPVADPPSECFLLQDQESKRAWSLTPSAWADPQASYQVRHGQGYSVMTHRSADLHVTLSCCVDAHSSVKQVLVQIVNHGDRRRRLRLLGIIEWIMGADRSERMTVGNAIYRERLASLDETEVEAGDERRRKLSALLCTQRECVAGFGGGTAFFALASALDEVEDWTCDRREFFNSDGQLVLPQHLGKSDGAGLDPCAALSTSLELEVGASVQRCFLLGYAPTVEAARQLALLAAEVPAERRLTLVRNRWNTLLGAAQVHTPDRLFDAMVNRWLLYQTVTCRMWAKAGFYQASGATGFRDQLQDALALTWSAPDLLREQILLCASRQFSAGDVQHWWHGPAGNGVRTHFSDDLLWLPYACSHYLRRTGDAALLDQDVAFIEGASIPDGADDVYDTPRVSSEQASVFEHAARSIDRSLLVGAHGLPLMGCGDWNDGMNRVGHEGRGESVWLGWFLCKVVADFAPLARARGELARATRWERAAEGWRQALGVHAWDGAWFRRAFFDNGEALGSASNAEARIDLIAQAWAVLSGAASPAQQRVAMAALEAHLVDPQMGLIQLIAPPLVHAKPNAGYIQAYPAGVRENGGQYSHAGTWAVMAQAELARSEHNQTEGDKAYRYFTYLSPAHRAHHPTRGPVYAVEPYVMAGDVYSQPPFVGRGGWSWYTGAAAWLHRAAIESIFGLQQQAQTLCFKPCLPSHWQEAELILVRDGRRMRFVFVRGQTLAAQARAAQLGATVLSEGELVTWTGLPAHSCFVIDLAPWSSQAPHAQQGDPQHDFP